MEVIYKMKMEADERKKQIRQAAMKVFLDKGFRNTVMNDIMELLGFLEVDCIIIMVLPMKFYTTLWWKEINTERR